MRAILATFAVVTMMAPAAFAETNAVLDRGCADMEARIVGEIKLLKTDLEHKVAEVRPSSGSGAKMRLPDEDSSVQKKMGNLLNRTSFDDSERTSRLDADRARPQSGSASVHSSTGIGAFGLDAKKN